MLKTVCMGESVWTLRGPGAVGMAVPAAPFKDAVKKVAEAGDCHEQHSLTLVSDMAITSSSFHQCSYVSSDAEVELVPAEHHG